MEGLLDNKVLVIRIPKEDEIDKNLTGLIANILMDKYRRPVLLLNQTSHEDGVWWEGSGRGYQKSKLTDFKEFLYECGLEDFGGYGQGHANAFGFGISDTRFKEFLDIVYQRLANFTFDPCYKVDFIYGMRDCQPADILSIANLKSIWGQGVEEPKIAFERITVSANNLTLMSPDKNPTLKITLPNGIACIKFKSSQEEFESLNPKQGCITLNIVGKCEKNEWNGNVTPQIIVEDYEVTNTQEYYF